MSFDYEAAYRDGQISEATYKLLKGEKPAETENTLEVGGPSETAELSLSSSEPRQAEGGNDSYAAQLGRGLVGSMNKSLGSGVIDVAAGTVRAIGREVLGDPKDEKPSLIERVGSLTLFPTLGATGTGFGALPEALSAAGVDRKALSQAFESKLTKVAEGAKASYSDFIEFMTPQYFKEAPLELTAELQQKLAKATDSYEKEDILSSAMWEQRPLERVAKPLGSAIGSMLPGIVAAYITKNPKVFLPILSGMGAAGQYQEAFVAREEGRTGFLTEALDDISGNKSPEVAAALSYAMNFATESVSIGKEVKNLLKPVVQESLKKFTGNVLITGAKEATQEVIQTVLENAIAKFGYDEGREYTAGWLDAAIGGAGAGTTVGMLTQSYERTKDPAVRELKVSATIDKLRDTLSKQTKVDESPMYDINEVNLMIEPIQRIASRFSLTEEQLQQMVQVTLKDFTGTSPDELYSIMGERFAKALNDGTVNVKLSVAKELDENGTEAPKIWAQTGWWKTPYGWLYELDPDLIQIKPPSNLEMVDIGPKTTSTRPLSSLIRAKELLAVAPYLRDIPVEYYYNDKQTQRGVYYPQSKRIGINFANIDNQQDFQDVLTHEIEHAIEDAEGLPVGVNPNDDVIAERVAEKGKSYDERAKKLYGSLLQRLPPSVRQLLPKPEEHLSVEAVGKGDLGTRVKVTNPMGYRYIDLPIRLEEFRTIFGPIPIYTYEPDAKGFVYRSGFGEVLARLATLRRNMTAKERRSTTPMQSLQIMLAQEGIEPEDIWDPQNRTFALQQQQNGNVRGTFTFIDGIKRIITLTKHATKDTFLHETGHLYMTFLNSEQLAILAKETGTNFDALSRYRLGRPLQPGDFEQVKLAGEPFANGFVRYLAEGYAPNPSMQQMFSKFSRFLRTLFGTPEAVPGSQNLSPEIRKLYADLMNTKGTVQGHIYAVNLAPHLSLMLGGTVTEKDGKYFVVVRDKRDNSTKTVNVTALMPETFPVDPLDLKVLENVLGYNAKFIETDYSGTILSEPFDDIGFVKYTQEQLELMSDAKLRKLARKLQIQLPRRAERANIISQIVNDGRYLQNGLADQDLELTREEIAGIGSMKWAVSGYALSMIRNISFRFPDLKEISFAAQRCVDHTHRLLGEYSSAVKRLQKLVSGVGTPQGWNMTSADLVNRIMRPITVLRDGQDKMWLHRWQSIVDSRTRQFLIGDVSPEEQEFAAAYAELYNIAGIEAERGTFMFQGNKVQGLRRKVEKQVIDSNGAVSTVISWEPVKRTPDLMQRVWHPDFFDLLYNSSEDTLKRFAFLLAKLNTAGQGMENTITGIRGADKLHQTLKNIRAQKMYGRPIALESVSTIPIVPAVVEIGGKLYNILENDPYIVARRMAIQTSTRFGFLQEFDTDPKFLDRQHRKELSTGDSQEKMGEYVRLIAALSGVPVYDRTMTPRHFAEAVKVYRAFARVIKAGLYSTSITTNLVEPFTKIPTYAGMERLVSAEGELGKLGLTHIREAGQRIFDPSRGNSALLARIQKLEEMGYVSYHVPRKMFKQMRNFGHLALGDYLYGKADALSNLILRKSGVVSINEVNEIVAAVAGEKFVEDAIAGRLSTDDRLRLARLGYNEDEIDKIFTQRGRYQDLLRTLPQRMVATTQNTNLLPAEISKVGNNKLYNDLVIADSFTRNTMGRMILLGYDVYLAEQNKRSAEERKDKWNRMADMMVAMLSPVPLVGGKPGEAVRQYFRNHIYAGAFTMLLRNSIKLAGVASVLSLIDWDDDDDGIIDDLLDKMGELFSTAFMGGLMSNIWYSNRTSTKTDNPVLNAAITMTNATFPVNSVGRLVQAFGGYGGYAGLDFTERMLRYMNDTVSISRSARNLIHGLILDDRANELDYAEKVYYAFERKYIGRKHVYKSNPAGGTKETEEILRDRKLAREKIKKMVRSMTDQKFGSAGVDKRKLRDLAEEASLLLSNDRYATFNGIILNTRMDIPEQHRKEWKRYASPRVQKIVDEYNTMVEGWAE